MPTTDELKGAILSAVDAYGSAREADGAASRQAEVDALTAQVADLTQQLADCQGEHHDPDPVTTTLAVGARIKNESFEDGRAQIGPISCTRFFEGSSIPTQQYRSYPGSAGKVTVPDDVVLWVSFDPGVSDSDLAAYVKSADPRTVMIPQHEVERKWPTGQAYKDWAAARIKVIRDNSALKVAQVSASSEYVSNGAGVDGSFILPPDLVDYYCIDTYQKTLDGASRMEPLEQDDRWLRWLSHIPAGRPIGITEYGRGLGPSDDAENAKRVELIETDYAYLQSNPGGHQVVTWQYWWTENSGGDWHFEDQASKDAWKRIATENRAAQ